MSFFETEDQAGYIQRLARFVLHPLPNGWVASAELIDALESKANLKASRVEHPSLCFSERFCLGADYLGMTLPAVARTLSVSYETVRDWSLDEDKPEDMEALANLLKVPRRWLEEGGIEHLPANSHIGGRVGKQARELREILFSQTLENVGEVTDDANAAEIQLWLDSVVNMIPTLKSTSRRAGGRWQIIQGNWMFAPWFPRVLIRQKHWPDPGKTPKD